MWLKGQILLKLKFDCGFEMKKHNFLIFEGGETTWEQIISTLLFHLDDAEKRGFHVKLTFLLCLTGAVRGLCSVVAHSARSDSSGNAGRRARPPTDSPTASWRPDRTEAAGGERWCEAASLCYCCVQQSVADSAPARADWPACCCCCRRGWWEL